MTLPIVAIALGLFAALSSLYLLWRHNALSTKVTQIHKTLDRRLRYTEEAVGIITPETHAAK